MTDAFDARMRELVDKQDIYEVLVRYLRAVDRGDVAALRQCYHDGATENHGGVFDGLASDYVDEVAPTITHKHALTAHVLSNVLIEVEGDRAVSECYVTTFGRVWTGHRTADSLVGARLIDQHERRQSRWAITHRELVWEWNHDMSTDEGWLHGLLAADPSQLIKGGKYPDDIVYRTAP